VFTSEKEKRVTSLQLLAQPVYLGLPPARARFLLTTGSPLLAQDAHPDHSSSVRSSPPSQNRTRLTRPIDASTISSVSPEGQVDLTSSTLESVSSILPILRCHQQDAGVSETASKDAVEDAIEAEAPPTQRQPFLGCVVVRAPSPFIPRTG
jgi:hypothetical protein